MDQLQACIPPKQMHARAPQDSDVHSIVIRVAVIEHYNRAPPRSQHTMNLAYRAHRVGCVMQYAVRVDQIEGLVWEIQILGIGSTKLTPQIEKLETFLGQLN